MYVICFFLFTLKNIASIEVKNWSPKFSNENEFDQPFDHVNESYLPPLVSSGNYDWISSSGTTLFDSKESYIAFTGTRHNSAKNYSSVYTKESGIIVLCKSSVSTSLTFNLNMDCKILEQKSLSDYEGIYFGSVVRSVQFTKDTAAFIYCDPLWFDVNSRYKEPSGKCKMSLIKNFVANKTRDFEVCSSFKKCLGGFSVDIFSDSQNIDVIFGLPFSNSTLHLKQAQFNAMTQVVEIKGNFFNFGYSVAFAKDGSMYVSSPVSDENSPFVKMLNGEKFLPQNPKTQNYGGFGTSLDTVKVGNNLYGAVIGAPYQSKQNQPNVGAVFLACKGYATDFVMGENKYDYFGYAVARIGDIDYDGAEEFVVSAPSLNFDKPGKIYVYKTLPNCKIHRTPLQVYQSKINGFGVAISRGFDIDFNGWPDFFVTSLNSTKPSLFKMPTQQKVTCHWPRTEIDDILLKDDTFTVKIMLNSELVINFNDYFFQVALDFANKDEERFKVIDHKVVSKLFTLTIKSLSDFVDMDLKTVPLKLSIKGTRLCKKSDTGECFRSTAFNIQWHSCEQTIKLAQYICGQPNCASDLKLQMKPDINGSVIYLGDQKNYQRTLTATITNNGPEASPRVYMSINSTQDILIANIKSDFKKNVVLSPSGQWATIIVKESLPSGNDLKLYIDILYNQLNDTKPTSSIQFKVWGINDDAELENNEHTVNYSVLFKPNLIFSSKKVQNMIIDSRIKPPYLEAFKRIPVHELGTDLQYSYMVENKGPELKNVEFRFTFPHKTSNGKFILYLMDRIRLAIKEEWILMLPTFSRNNKAVGRCSVPKDLINPLQVIAVEAHRHENGEMSGGDSRRLKRSINNDKVVTYTHNRNDSMKTTESLSKSETVNSIPSSERSTLISCNSTADKIGLPICAEIVCTLDTIPMNSVFYFDFRAWVFTKTFFDSRLGDLIITTSMSSNIGDLPQGVSASAVKSVQGPFSVAQNVIFSKMVVIQRKALPLWPIIAAIIVGIILLAIIIIIAYYCGFFKRKRLNKEKKKQDANRLKNISADKEPLNSI